MLTLSTKTQLALGLAWLSVGLLVLVQWYVDQPRIEIVWQTESEFDSAGFNVLRGRSESGPFSAVNEWLIPASDDATAGAEYAFVDADVVAGQLYYYQLEDVDLSGDVTRHSPIAFTAPVQAQWLLILGAVLALVGCGLLIAAWLGSSRR